MKNFIFIMSVFISASAFSSVEKVVEKMEQYQSAKKPCLVTYNIEEKDKAAIFSILTKSGAEYFSEEGNLLITWGEKEKAQLQELKRNKTKLDIELDSGFNPDSPPPTFIKQINLLKDLTTKCK